METTRQGNYHHWNRNRKRIPEPGTDAHMIRIGLSTVPIIRSAPELVFDSPAIEKVRRVISSAHISSVLSAVKLPSPSQCQRCTLPSVRSRTGTGTGPGPGPVRGDTPGRRVVYLNLPAVPGAITVCGGSGWTLDASALRF